MADPGILLVEDSADDVELTRIAFDEARIANPLVVARDGAEALDYLFARGVHAGRDPAALPALVLLDLHLPGIDGREALQALRADPRTRALPVAVFTTGGEPFDAETIRALGVTACLRKPVDFPQLVDTVRRAGLPWRVLGPAEA